MGGGGGGSSTQTTKSEPWVEQQPYLKDLFQRAKEQSQIPIQYYQGNTVAPLSATQQQAISFAQNRPSMFAHPLWETTSGLLSDTISGKYLRPESNPYLSHYVTKAFEQTLPQYDTTATLAGRYGSDAWANMKARAMSDIASEIYGGAYEAERNRQLQAAGLLPQIGQLSLNEGQLMFDMLQKAGKLERDYEQDVIDAAIKKWQFEQLEPWQRLGLLSSLVSGDLGGIVTAQVQGGRGGK